MNVPAVTENNDFPVLFGRAFSHRGKRAVARTLAAEIAYEHQCGVPPVDPVRVARELGIRVEVRDIPSFGVLEGWPERPTIVIPALRGDERLRAGARQQFTLAHELGHAVLRWGMSSALGTTNIPSHDPMEEQFCDSFAAELLMPERCFQDDLRSAGISAPACLCLANRYGVSLQTVLARIGDFTRTGHNYIAMIWGKDHGSFVAGWATPGQLRGSWLNLSGKSSVERAALFGRPTEGADRFTRGLHSHSWTFSSTRLALTGKVLSIGRRRSCPYSFLPVKGPAGPTRPPKAAQLSLF